MRCFIANTPHHLDRVYRLRHQCYLRDASIDPRPDARFTDDFDTLRNSISILAESEDGDDLATVRISVVRPDLGWRVSPALHVFSDEPQLQEIAAEGYVEASRLCFGPQARRDAFVSLLGNMAALASFYEAEWLVACPRVEHSHSYQKMFGFRPLAAARQYFGVRFQTQLLGIRRSELRDHVRHARPMTMAWTEALGRLVQSAALPERMACLAGEPG